MRIVSLLPSATEIVCALGLGDQLVGVTHGCDYPPFVQQLPKVTRTLIPTEASSRQIDRLVREQLRTDRPLYTLEIPTLKKLRPDVLITQTLCNVCAVSDKDVRAVVRKLPGKPRVIQLEPKTLSQVFDAIRRIAEAVGVEQRANDLILQLTARMEAVVARSAGIKQRPRVALLEWLDPPFACGHWNPELVRLAGGVEGLGREGQPSYTLSWEEVRAWQPEVIVIACCGYDIERTLVDLSLIKELPDWQDLPAVRMGRVFVMNGSHYFSRPGPRLVDSLEILAHALHPETHPLPDPLRSGLRRID